MKRFLKGFLCGMLTTSMMLVVALTVGQFSGYIDLGAAWNRTDQDSTMKREVKQKASTIEKYIDAYYLDDINKDKMENSIYKGIVNGLGDDYAEYYTAEEYAEIMEKTSGTFYGIGAYVTQNTDTGAITIVKPMKNSPAEKAGLKAGDIIYAINDERVSGKDLSAVLAQIKGEEGSKVKLTIVRSRENDYLTFSVKRAKIQEDTVSYTMLNDKIGYIQITGFEEVTPNQFSTAVNALEKEKMEALILDLRDNGGGLLKSAVSMLDRVMSKGMVVYTKDKQGVSEKFYAEDVKHVSVPMAVLVNGNSASASEVFSGALQDKKKAKLIGTKTFGKGIVQTIFDLQDGSSLKMTTSKYYTPSGRNIHGTGLEPDIKVELDKSTVGQKDKNGKLKPDNQMQKAIDYLKGQIKG